MSGCWATSGRESFWDVRNRSVLVVKLEQNAAALHLTVANHGDKMF
jgi:hypothetical protein